MKNKQALHTTRNSKRWSTHPNKEQSDGKGTHRSTGSSRYIKMKAGMR